MDRARCHLSVVRDEPPLRGIRLRDELRTVHRIQQFLIWGALVVGVLAFCGCSKPTAVASPREDAMPPAGESPATFALATAAWCRSECPRSAVVRGVESGGYLTVSCRCTDDLRVARVPRGTP